MPIHDASGRTRAYFFDIDNKRELVAYVPAGEEGMAERNGVLLEDTIYAVEVHTPPRGALRTITAEDFLGMRVGVKFWQPDRPAYFRFLMRENEPGYRRARVVTGRPLGLLGKDARKLPRGEPQERRGNAPLPCLRKASRGELASADETIKAAFEGMRQTMIAGGLPRLKQTRMRIDRGPRESGRHFASTRNDGKDILVHQKTVLLPEAQFLGILAHELGHAADFLYPAGLEIERGIPELHRPSVAARARWETRSDDEIESFADQVAQAFLGVSIGYTGACQLQTLGKGRPRPAGLR